ncbi:acetyltransferase [Alloalcanivorax gelatiniphagus]|uniref:Acetyltransferase n=1 Tax=Alloalcanivorax gelatiniphagus TaxID=1194167 RepID=A0ABY2XP18_9GAMM|nr:acetyltransferase [Alloalcanivorax gelatiniphagus]
MVQLGDLLKELGDDDTARLLTAFSCNRNRDVENFLTHPSKAIRFEKTDNARTYLILDDETGHILGYFSISFKELVLEDLQISKSKVRRLDGISKNAERIRAFLIGQLGKNTSIAQNPITLEIILEEIYAVISEARNLIGGRIIILECEDSPQLIQLYERNGFSLIQTADEAQAELRTMYIHVAECVD